MHASLNAIIRTTIWLKKSGDVLIPGLSLHAEWLLGNNRVH